MTLRYEQNTINSTNSSNPLAFPQTNSFPANNLTPNSTPTMSKLLVVLGATGHQGTSLINHVFADPTLSSIYKIRAITRDTTSAKSVALASKVQVVQADITSRDSITAALKDAHTIFYTTFPSWEADKDRDHQYTSGTMVADVAVAQGAQYIIYSTLPAIKTISQGKYTKVTVFDVKAEIEDYIRTLPIKSAFVSLGSFMENYEEQFFLKPQKNDAGEYILKRNHSLDTLWPLLDATSDTGKFVGAILAAPAEFEGKRLHCAAKIYTYAEVIALLEKSSGKKIVFQQVSSEEFAKGIPVLQEVFVEASKWGEEFGYFGPGQEELVNEAVKVVRGKLTTFEEFLERQPFTLE
ncbi:unnamed protein product [Periconia digitata]|uniref:NmrA-like domain-containing protein n=1 Tax=Periconia digitata TaxID=1303443 RepID=A0A9W4UFQ4_9PLEO|nr:unnamed protein product [Periconia digitata]